jgi:hypothetical protein
VSAIATTITPKKMRRERNIDLISKNFFRSHSGSGHQLHAYQKDMHIVILALSTNFPPEITFHREKP